MSSRYGSGSEKPGTVQRTFAACVSRTDALEATLVGQAAVGYALDGHNGVMVTLVREPGPAYSLRHGASSLGCGCREG